MVWNNNDNQMNEEWKTDKRTILTERTEDTKKEIPKGQYENLNFITNREKRTKKTTGITNIQGIRKAYGMGWGKTSTKWWKYVAAAARKTEQDERSFYIEKH